MRIISLIKLIVFFIVFGLYISFVNLWIDQTLLKAIIFVFLLYVLDSVSERLQRRFAFLEKRIDKQLSIMIVFALFVLLMLVEF